MKKITDIAANAAKAIVGAAAPILTAAVLDILTEIGILASGAIAGAVTLIGVWSTPNKELPK